MTTPMLEGIRVLDFTRLLPGPFCTLLFADMGADVIKIEDTRGGDYARYYPPMVGDSGAFFASVNRNKRSMKLNLKTPEGVAIARKLVAEADVVIESFRPGVMAKLGVGYDDLRAIKPDIIYCAISGYGQTGPMRDKAGHDLNYMAHAGLLDQNGATTPQVPGFQLADIAGGALYAALGVTAALFRRTRTGEGAFLDISMTDGALSFAIPMLANARAGADISRGQGMLTGGISAYNVYETSDGRHLAVGSLEPKFWSGFLQAIGAPELVGDGHDAGAVGRTAQARIAEIIRTRPLAEWTARFDAIDVCVEPILNAEEVLESELHRARELFFTLSGTTHVRTPLTPVNLEHVEPPAYGAHTRMILEAAGYSDDEVRAFEEAGVI